MTFPRNKPSGRFASSVPPLMITGPVPSEPAPNVAPSPTWILPALIVVVPV